MATDWRVVEGKYFSADPAVAGQVLRMDADDEGADWGMERMAGGSCAVGIVLKSYRGRNFR
jgi:hypothetical protein